MALRATHRRPTRRWPWRRRSRHLRDSTTHRTRPKEEVDRRPPVGAIANMTEAPGHDAQFAAAIAGWPVVLAVAGAAEGPLPAPKAGIAHTGRNPAPALTR